MKTESRKLPQHLFLCHDGGLYDTRDSEWSRKPPLRPNYGRASADLEYLADIKAALRSGPYAWPGGYEFVYLTADGATLCSQCVRSEFRCIAESVRDNDSRSGWRVNGLMTTADGDDSDIVCDNCSRVIYEAPPADEANEESKNV